MSIRFIDVTKKFHDRLVLDQVSFEVERGKILFILGKSGVGKSVTLKHIIGMLEPDSGKIFVDDLEVTAFFTRETRDLLKEVRKKCGMVFQHPALLDSLTLFENIAFSLRNKNLTDAEKELIVRSKAKLVHLAEEHLSSYPNEVAYGIQKRASLARTLAIEPSYLLFDEPTTGLDPLSTASINHLILELSHNLNVTSIIVSHDMACALSIADQILFLDQGKVLLQGTPEEIKKSKIPLVEAFLEETLTLDVQKKEAP